MNREAGRRSPASMMASAPPSTAPAVSLTSARVTFLRPHRLQHLRATITAPQALAPEFLPDARHLLSDLDAEIAARHHDRIRHLRMSSRWSMASPPLQFRMIGTFGRPSSTTMARALRKRPAVCTKLSQ